MLTSDYNLYIRYELIVVLVAAVIFLGCLTARLDGVPCFEKPPFKYWMIVGSYKIFGVHDWSARLPIALSVIALCWLTARIGRWAFSPILTLTITLAMWAFLRALEEDEPHPRGWASIMAASMGTGLLLKGLIAAIFPIGGGLPYLLLTRQLFARRTGERLRPFSGTLIILLIAAPWHVLATVRNHSAAAGRAQDEA